MQLRGASRAVVLLAAELVFLREHPVRSALPTTRRSHVERVLSQLQDPPTIPEALSAGLNRPSKVAGFQPGNFYNGALWLHLIWSATFVRHWASLSDAERAAARSDVWALEQVMLDSGADRADMRNALLFLARPDDFEPISSASMKLKIRDGLADRIDGATGNDPVSIDRDLLAIRADLAGSVSGAFHFWTPGVSELWNPVATNATDLQEPRPRHYWIYSPSAQASEWADFSSTGIMAIAWDELADLSTFSSKEGIRAALAVDGAATPRPQDVQAIWQFQNEIEIGDVVYVRRGKREIIGRGEVTSVARHDPGRETYSHLRSVTWDRTGTWEFPGDSPVRILTDITAKRDLVEKLEGLLSGDHEEDPTPVIATPLPTYDASNFLDEVYVSEERYARLASLLRRKKNVILAGPPGVGKTYAAKRLAYSLMGVKDPGRVQMVQFHQSYSYEDFMMGYRPTESGGFTLTEGPFYRFCEAARADDADRPYFFIIDEINRGNISKILGELLMLIEADKRGHELRLLYKNETFSVPPNLHIIGMMNTADRSLAVLDYALRRRFGFFEMSPGFASDGFQRWLQVAGSTQLDQLVAVVVDLNKAIAEDPALGSGFAVGHSFLSRSASSDDDGWLASVVEDELVPLLDEYWFDEPTRAEEWAARLRAALA